MSSTTLINSVSINNRYFLKETFIGFLFGFFILHPVSMLIFRWLDFSAQHHGDHGSANPLLGPIVHSFQLDMVPMGLVFGLFCALIAHINGRYRRTITLQRDSLSEQLKLNERYRAELEEQADLLRKRNEKLAELEQANRRNTQYMVHDFKTHLGAILGFSNLLLEKDGMDQNEEVDTALRRIRRQALQMMGEVNDLLDYARFQNKKEICMEEATVSELLTEAANDFSIPEHFRRIEVGEEHCQCGTVHGNPRLLKRIFTNLITNALKHNSPKTQVKLDAKPSLNGDRVVFSCCDDGNGIPAEILPSIFEDFTTVSSDVEGSTGLGLAFCKTTVELHGGRIWCESRINQGTAFYFTIPFSCGGER